MSDIIQVHLKAGYLASARRSRELHGEVIPEDWTGPTFKDATATYLDGSLLVTEKNGAQWDYPLDAIETIIFN